MHLSTIHRDNKNKNAIENEPLLALVRLLLSDSINFFIDLYLNEYLWIKYQSIALLTDVLHSAS